MSSSNVSIEEIGPDEIEENSPAPDEEAEILLPDEAGDFDTAGNKETVKEPAASAAPTEANDDPPLEPLSAPASAAEPSVESSAAVPAQAATDPPAYVKPSVAAVAKKPPPPAEDDEEDDDDIDETLIERLVGLTEMFPESLTSGTVSLIKGSFSMTKSAYSFGRSAAWVVFTTATILFLPVMLETERLGLEDQQKAHKSQMLLGPGVASSGGAPSLGPPPI